MAIRIKAGTNFVLPVTIEDDNFGNISAIEFIFKQNLTGDTLKTAYWSAEGESRDASRKSGENTILVRFSRAETYRFKENAPFYMDTRIHYNESEDNPYTKIITLTMSETLFGDGEEVGP